MVIITNDNNLLRGDKRVKEGIIKIRWEQTRVVIFRLYDAPWRSNKSKPVFKTV